MAIDFECGACGQSMSVEESMAGKEGICPACFRNIAVPGKERKRPSLSLRRIVGLGVVSVSLALFFTALALRTVDRSRRVIQHPPSDYSTFGSGPVGKPSAAPDQDGGRFGYQVGPRGGVYRHSSGGRKVYDSKR